MYSPSLQIGTVVRVKDGHRREYLRGKLGTIQKHFGHPEYLAVDVLLEDGRLELFWHYDLEEVQDEVDKVPTVAQKVSRKPRNDHGV